MAAVMRLIVCHEDQRTASGVCVNNWAFANPKTRKPFVSIFCVWDTARKRAGLSDVRVHDLRHSFASLLVNTGRTLYEVQHILGHTQVKRPSVTPI